MMDIMTQQEEVLLGGRVVRIVQEENIVLIFRVTVHVLRMHKIHHNTLKINFHICGNKLKTYLGIEG